MRLLDTETFELRSGDQSVFKDEGYAILSHRWVGQEITFDQLANHAAELRAGQPPMTPQLAKIRGACETARRQGLKWMWIDTCCINKTSAVEETESINSMFKWYRDAKICITYLCDVRRSTNDLSVSRIFESIDSGGYSIWFTRGWTLQEMLAPPEMQFYDMNWKCIGTKAELAEVLQRVTGIDAAYLTGEKYFGSACIATKMSWMAARRTEREEDITYSMLGIFNIILTPRYGEGGMRAFMRLQQALLSTSTDESLFAWRMPEAGAGDTIAGWAADEWGLMAASPKWFEGSRRLTTDGKRVTRHLGGFSMTQQGLQLFIPLIVMEAWWVPIICICGPLLPLALLGLCLYQGLAKPPIPDIVFTLNCWEQDEFGRLVPIGLFLRVVSKEGRLLKRARCNEFGSEEKKFGRTQSSKHTPEAHVVLQPEQSYPD
ncbi:heterokaryon incompatibility protein-domain-containing protein [Hypoxylon fuscum]|nr:heterokaryon incompatibility protein-domain-containing protein [Hypoxylon fuscum]